MDTHCIDNIDTKRSWCVFVSNLIIAVRIYRSLHIPSFSSMFIYSDVASILEIKAYLTSRKNQRQRKPMPPKTAVTFTNLVFRGSNYDTDFLTD